MEEESKLNASSEALPLATRIEKFRNAHILDIRAYVTGVILSHLEGLPHDVSLGIDDLDMYARFLNQIQASKLSPDDKETMQTTLREVLEEKIPAEAIETTASTYRKDAINKTVQERVDAYIGTTKFFRPTWEALQQEFPVLQKVRLSIASPSVDPVQGGSAAHADSVSPARISLAFNWKLMTEITKQLFPHRVKLVANALGIQPSEVTNDMMIGGILIHESGHANHALTDPSGYFVEKLASSHTVPDEKEFRKLPNAEAVQRLREDDEQIYRQLPAEKRANTFVYDFMKTHRDIFLHS